MEKAFILFSGGLDSIIAVKLLRNFGFNVIGVHFRTPFFGKEKEELEHLAKALDIELLVSDITEDFLPVLKNPPNGYGKNINPCIDCKALMLKKLKGIAGENIIATGEVLGQRPMSQRGVSLKKIEKIAGLERRVFRPLSAKVLPKTVYEEEGIVDIDCFLDIKGRSRKQYPKIIKELSIDIENLPTPAGGCLLTESSYVPKVKDLIENNQLTVKDAELLKIGRHFRIGEAKLVVGKDRAENEKLEKMFEGDEILLYTESVPGPSAILRWEDETGVILKCAEIVARYSKGKDRDVVAVIIERADGKKEKLEVKPSSDIERFRIN